jgi:hypothetical protein
VTIDFRANIRIGNLKNSCGFSNRNYQWAKRSGEKQRVTK